VRLLLAGGGNVAPRRSCSPRVAALSAGAQLAALLCRPSARLSREAPRRSAGPPPLYFRRRSSPTAPLPPPPLPPRCSSSARAQFRAAPSRKRPEAAPPSWPAVRVRPLSNGRGRRPQARPKLQATSYKLQASQPQTCSKLQATSCKPAFM